MPVDAVTPRNEPNDLSRRDFQVAPSRRPGARAIRAGSSTPRARGISPTRAATRRAVSEARRWT